MLHEQILDLGHPGSRNVRAGREMSEHEDPRGGRSQGGEEQASVLQPEYDGSHNTGAGEFIRIVSGELGQPQSVSS